MTYTNFTIMATTTDREGNGICSSDPNNVQQQCFHANNGKCYHLLNLGYGIWTSIILICVYYVWNISWWTFLKFRSQRSL